MHKLIKGTVSFSVNIFANKKGKKSFSHFTFLFPAAKASTEQSPIFEKVCVTSSKQHRPLEEEEGL